MIPIVFDANYLVAWFDHKDNWYARVRNIEEALPKESARIFLDIALTEAISVMARRCEEQRRTDDYQRILARVKEELPPTTLEWFLPFVRSNYEECLDLMESHHGKFNFNDALIISFMRQNELSLPCEFR